MRKQYSTLLAIGLVILAGCSGQITKAPLATSTSEPPVLNDPLRSGDEAPDFTLPDRNGNMVNLADALEDNKMVVLVFYFSHGCNLCMLQLSGLENDSALYEEKGAQIIAVAVQSQEQAALSVNKSEAQFPILADSEHSVAEAYGTTYLSLGLVGREDNRWSRSGGAVFIIDPKGQIIWEYIAKDLADRASSQTILENLPESN